MRKCHVLTEVCSRLVVAFESLHRVQLFATPQTAARQASLSFIISRNWLKLMSIESVMPPNHFILCHPLLLPSIFPSIRSFQMSWPFASGGQRIGASASAPVLPKNIQDWFPLGLTGLIPMQPKGLSRVFSNSSLKASILWSSAFFMVQLSHPYMTTRKPQLWLYEPLLAK